MADQKITLLASPPIAIGKEKEAEAYWRLINENVVTHYRGRITFQLHKQHAADNVGPKKDEQGSVDNVVKDLAGGSNGRSFSYVVFMTFESVATRDEWVKSEFHIELAKKVTEQGLLDGHPVHGEHVMFLRGVFGSED